MNILNAFKNIASQPESFLPTLSGSIRRFASTRSTEECIEQQLLTNTPEISLRRLARSTMSSSIQLVGHSTRKQEVLQCSDSRVLSRSRLCYSSKLGGIYRHGHSLLGITRESLFFDSTDVFAKAGSRMLSSTGIREIPASSSTSMEEIRPASSKYPPIPTPYVYALLSKAAYYDNIDVLRNDEPNIYDSLTRLDWRLYTSIQEGEYHGAIWINDSQNQLVIAHRGSQNLGSWLTDIEAVIQLKSGSFIRSAINTLFHPVVCDYIQKKYRLSTTGHSLGGFLAQVCVYWSKRRDFSLLDQSTKDDDQISFPELSAAVFDSPGVVDFLGCLQSNIKSEHSTVDVAQLNIQNYCGMPTVVSTYGTQTGTIWHLGLDEPGKQYQNFVFAHKMEHILSGFDETTGQPHRLRQMTDWPEADYSDFQSLNSVGKGALRMGVDFLNKLYKRIKGDNEDTRLDQIYLKKGQVWEALKNPAATNREKNLSVEEFLDSTLKAHYSPLSEEDSCRRIGLFHLDSDVQAFLRDYDLARFWGFGKIGWNDALKRKYGETNFAFFELISLQTCGSRTDVVLSKDYPRTVFDYHQQLLKIFDEHGIFPMANFIQERYDLITQTFDGIYSQIDSVAKKTETEELKTQISEIRKCLSEVEARSTGRTIRIRTAVAARPGTDAIRVLGEIDYRPERVEENIRVIESSGPNDTIEIDCARADHDRANATVISHGADVESAIRYANALRRRK